VGGELRLSSIFGVVMSRLEIYGVEDVIEYHSMDKSEWSLGEWTEEPDKVQFVDSVTKLPCLIVRNKLGALCGYAGVNSAHPYYGLSYSDDAVAWIRVHGGLTFSDRCQHGSPPDRGICHVVQPGEDDNIWWFGFDSSHLGDYSPSLCASSLEQGGIYRNLTYLIHQVKSLALQLGSVTHE
jgi:hypothetical protein